MMWMGGPYCLLLGKLALSESLTATPNPFSGYSLCKKLAFKQNAVQGREQAICRIKSLDVLKVGTCLHGK